MPKTCRAGRKNQLRRLLAKYEHGTADDYATTKRTTTLTKNTNGYSRVQIKSRG